MNLDLKIVSRDINELMWKSGKSLSAAESCTAGRISSILTATPGSSLYFKGGVVSYADEVKEELLGVKKETLEAQTAVCEDVVRQMVIGANKIFHSDFSVAISGYAGPGGGTAEAPVGTIWIAVGSSSDIVTCKLSSDNGRDKNLDVATFTAMQMLRDYLKKQDLTAQKL